MKLGNEGPRKRAQLRNRPPHGFGLERFFGLRRGRWLPLLSLPGRLGIEPTQPLPPLPPLQPSAEARQRWLATDLRAAADTAWPGMRRLLQP